ncbi:MAG: hypothetical protein K8R74_03570 [Bacteroidales bacterium]|nr:hypothetical protein [Bacteroidales bacterium]
MKTRYNLYLFLVIFAFCSCGYGQEEIMISPVGSVTSIWINSKDDPLREGVLRAVGEYKIVLVDRLSDVVEGEYHTDITITDQDFVIKNGRGFLVVKYYGKYTFTSLPKSLDDLRERRKKEFDFINGFSGTRVEITKFRENNYTLEFYERKWKPKSENIDPSYIIINKDDIIGVNVKILDE